MNSMKVIGGKKLGYNLTVGPSGKKAWPFHNHHVNKEMFFILEGEGLLRYGESEYPLRQGDVIAAPPGKRNVSHQIINTGKVDLKYLAVSTREKSDACEYPDSGKIGVTIGDDWENLQLRHLFRPDSTIDYWDDED